MDMNTLAIANILTHVIPTSLDSDLHTALYDPTRPTNVAQFSAAQTAANALFPLSRSNKSLYRTSSARTSILRDAGAARRAAQLFHTKRRVRTKPQKKPSQTRRFRDAIHQAFCDNFSRISLLSTGLVKSIIAGLEVRPFSQQERESYLYDTQERIAGIRELEEKQDRIAPRRYAGVESELFLERLEYRIRFGRAFRINDLPNEILTNIFRFVVWGQPDAQRGYKWRLWITSACVHWRNVAIEDSTLWNAIWFQDRPLFERSLTWFQRAKNAPLDIRINDSKGDILTAEAMDKLLTTLFEKISTIRMLLVFVQDWEAAMVVITKMQRVGIRKLPMILERFELHRQRSTYSLPSQGYIPSDYFDPLPLFAGAHIPTLSYISLNAVFVDWGKTVVKNLTTLDLRRVPLERAPDLMQFRDMLQNSPLLRKLVLDSAGPSLARMDDACKLPPIELPHLKHLVLSNLSMHYGSIVLSQFNPINVGDLTLTGLVGEDYSPLLNYLGKLPRVRVLTLWNVEIGLGAQEIYSSIKWLDSMPQLSYLRLAGVQQHMLELFLYKLPNKSLPTNYVDSPFDIISRNSTPSTSRLVCPQLSTIECQTPMDPQAIADWVVARGYIGAPIRSLHVGAKLYSQLNEPQKRALRQLGNMSCLEVGMTAPEEVELTGEL